MTGAGAGPTGYGPCSFQYAQTMDGPAFCDMMEGVVNTYIEKDLAWADVFLHDRLPWASGTSLDNAYSGVLSRLWRAHGRKEFLKGFFRAIPLLTSRKPANKCDWQCAADNFFLASCYAARADLSAFFAPLKWPVSSRAMAFLPGLLASA